MPAIHAARHRAVYRGPARTIRFAPMTNDTHSANPFPAIAATHSRPAFDEALT